MYRFYNLTREYEPWAKARKAKTTVHRERSKMKLLLKAFGDCQLRKITTRMIERYMETRLQTVGPRTVNLELALLRHMLKKAEDWGYLKNNPAQKVKPFREPPGRIRYLNREEYTRLLTICKLIPGLFEIVLTALETGMRKGELMGLTWNDVDLERRDITFDRTKNNQTRYIPISDALFPVLKQLAKNRKGLLVFTKPNGTPYGDPYHRLIRACKWAGITNFRFHDLRHTFASYLAMSGVNISTVQKLMGHKRIEMTMKYTHLSNSYLRAAVNRTDNFSVIQTRLQI